MTLKRILITALAVTSAACGGGGGGTSLPSQDNQSDTQQPAQPANPLNLSPAPQFSPSTRTVTYKDCFPEHTDVQVGDVVTSRIEQYSQATGITTYDTTQTVQSVSPYNFNGQTGISIVSDIPPQSTPNSLMHGVRSITALLQGAIVTLEVRNYLNEAAGDRYIITDTPTQIEDISLGHVLTSFRLGDNVINKRISSFQDIYNPAHNSQATVSEKITFIGVEEGTRVAGYNFDYTCVFRIGITSDGTTSETSVADMYFHKYSGAKTVIYSTTAPRPLVLQLVSNSAIARRLAAPQ